MNNNKLVSIELERRDFKRLQAPKLNHDFVKTYVKSTELSFQAARVRNVDWCAL